MPPASPPARIAVLPPVVRDQIAAGEVIDRPASVVKELIENALDAGARSIRVDLEGGGARLVRVTDDGRGMVAADVELAFEAHATSKLSDPSDLEHIASLGFRGEALASMGSVARCSLFSRPPEASLGQRVEVVGGRRSPLREAGGAVGTIVEVRDLFFNTPARRRFLKRTSTELSRCLDVIQRAALAQVEVGLVATHEGARVYDVEPTMDLAARIRRTFGAELADSLVSVEARDGKTSLHGFVAPPRFARRDTARQMWFLNGRPVRDRVLLRVLREGYRGFLVEGRQPVVFLHLSLDPASVDVNVHPAKTEVRLRDGRRLFGFLASALREAVSRTDMATPGGALLARAGRRGPDPRQGRLPSPGPYGGSPAGGVQERAGVSYEIPRPVSPGSAASGVPHGLAGSPESSGSPGAPESPASGGSPGSTAEDGSWEPRDDLAGPFLQIARTYLVRALPDGFEIVDQHALHERLTFEQLRADVREGHVEVQRFLVPELVECSRSEVQLLAGHVEGLARIGIELAAFGEETIAVHGLPARLAHPDVQGVVRDLVDVLVRTGALPDSQDVMEEVLHRTACRSSIMAGDELTDDEIRALLERAGQLESDQTCPHARPTRVRFTLADLEKAFHRR